MWKRESRIWRRNGESGFKRKRAEIVEGSEHVPPTFDQRTRCFRGNDRQSRDIGTHLPDMESHASRAVLGHYTAPAATQLPPSRFFRRACIYKFPAACSDRNLQAATGDPSPRGPATVPQGLLDRLQPLPRRRGSRGIPRRGPSAMQVAGHAESA